MLIIQPMGGLCNRMRAINSARILAEKRGEKLQVVWNVNPELGCPFEELFQPTDAFTYFNIHSKWNLKKMFYQLTRSRIGNDELRDARVDGNLPDSYVSSLSSSLYIKTEEHFFVNHDYSPFMPSKDILAKQKKLMEGFGPHNVGVHVRRTDNKPAIGKSSTDAFISSMEKELALHPDTKFYLATDDLSEEARLREHFPNCIISNEGRDLSRDSVTGIKDAFVDLLCLSATDKIIGSYFSSFTDIAADMHGIEKIIAGEE